MLVYRALASFGYSMRTVSESHTEICLRFESVGGGHFDAIFDLEQTVSMVGTLSSFVSAQGVAAIEASSARFQDLSLPFLTRKHPLLALNASSFASGRCVDCFQFSIDGSQLRLSLWTADVDAGYIALDVDVAHQLVACLMAMLGMV